MKWMTCLLVFVSLGFLTQGRMATPLKPLVVPPPPPSPPPPQVEAARQAQAKPLPEPFLKLRTLHEEFAHEFVLTPGNGRARVQKLVHAMEENSRDTFTMENQTWKIESMELAGLMQPVPVIYNTPIPTTDLQHRIKMKQEGSGDDRASIDKTFGSAKDNPSNPKAGLVFLIENRNDPKLEAFAKHTKRDADEFEADAIARLMIDRSGCLAGDVAPVIKMGTDSIRMVGALRATSDCLLCHSERTIEAGKTKKLERGDVIGALVYTISRVKNEQQK